MRLPDGGSRGAQSDFANFASLKQVAEPEALNYRSDCVKLQSIRFPDQRPGDQRSSSMVPLLLKCADVPKR